ncbi:craniofacial development protein 1-like [Pollicipes pollicipes]|uniref:craniofacial development protein 1-like n=1 Tax=Pollicipes pollicipes TaxID=41117 RepID=UPI00188522D4|nr:craniofacial development protein 1-like [Pollicipes pollicipes]
MDDEEYGSDSSDEDYKPGGESDVSEEEGEGDPEELDAVLKEAGKSAQKGKRQKRQPKGPRKKRALVLEGEEDTTPETHTTKTELEESIQAEKLQKQEEKEKKKADDLFADFMRDVSGPKPRPKPTAGAGLGGLVTAAGGGAASKPAPEALTSKPAPPAKVTVTKVFDFAGEAVTVTKDVDVSSREAKRAATGGTGSSQPSPQMAVPSRRGGLAGLVNNLGKKPKMSVLEKSRLDWVGFKKEENLEEELDRHKRSKNSFLDKQEFLQRADQRQFELEKSARERNRPPR